jgi:hypothetical protein
MSVRYLGADSCTEETTMDLAMVRKLLTDAIDHSKTEPDKAAQEIAQALIQVAEAVDEIRRRLPARPE